MSTLFVTFSDTLHHLVSYFATRRFIGADFVDLADTSGKPSTASSQSWFSNQIPLNQRRQRVDLKSGSLDPYFWKSLIVPWSSRNAATPPFTRTGSTEVPDHGVHRAGGRTGLEPRRRFQRATATHRWPGLVSYPHGSRGEGKRQSPSQSIDLTRQDSETADR